MNVMIFILLVEGKIFLGWLLIVVLLVVVGLLFIVNLVYVVLFLGNV